MSRGSASFEMTAGRLAMSALAGALSVLGCTHQEDAGPAAPQAPGTPAAPANVIVEPPPAPATAAAPAASAGPQAPQIDPPVVLKDMGFKTPECVLYDPEQDAYLVSNINGKPTDVDANGFISKVSPDGKTVELLWIDGSKKASALNAPKGLALSGGVLYVADLNFVRMFDRKTGAPKGKVVIPGATFLNDLATGPDGSVYVSDTGVKLGKEGFEPTGSDSIYKITKGTKVEKVIADKELLGRPNGIVVDDSGVWVVTFGSGELYRVAGGKKEPGQKLPAGQLDGLVKLPDGTFLASSWASSAVFRGTPGGTFESIIHDVKSPADIGYDPKRNVVMIPLFQLDAVALQKLPGVAPVSTAPAAAAPAPAAPATPAAAAAPAPAKGAPAAAAAAPAANKPAPAAATPPKGAPAPATPPAPVTKTAPTPAPQMGAGVGAPATKPATPPAMTPTPAAPPAPAPALPKK